MYTDLSEQVHDDLFLHGCADFRKHKTDCDHLGIDSIRLKALGKRSRKDRAEEKWMDVGGREVVAGGPGAVADEQGPVLGV